MGCSHIAELIAKRKILNRTHRNSVQSSDILEQQPHMHPISIHLLFPDTLNIVQDEDFTLIPAHCLSDEKMP